MDSLRNEKGRFVKGNEGYWKGKKRKGFITSTSFTKGSIPWNKGMKLAHVTGKKISKAHKGKPKPHKQGDKNFFWKGGITPENRRIRTSLRYRQWREKVFIRDDFTCQNCGQRGGRLNADHIKPFCSFPDLRFQVSNGQTLCEECHIKTDTFGRKALSYKH